MKQNDNRQSDNKENDKEREYYCSQNEIEQSIFDILKHLLGAALKR
jgi:hypothetical protein